MVMTVSWRGGVKLQSFVERPAPRRACRGLRVGADLCARLISARPRAAQYVGRHVEVVCNAFGYDASFSDFDLGHPGESDPRCLAPELKFLRRPQLHWTLQEESELAPTDCSRMGKSVAHEIEISVQRPGIETSDKRISEPIARGGRIDDLFQVGLRPTFDISTKW